MSAADRALKAQARADRVFALAVENGFRQALSTPEGRAMLWWLYAHECQTEAMGDHQRRAVGLALALQAKRASFAAWQIMREEHDQPKRIQHHVADESDSDSEQDEE